MYKHNNRLSPNQSGFRIGDSCTNQLLLITYDIFYSLGEGLETRAIFSGFLQSLARRNYLQVAPIRFYWEFALYFN